jgi:hypothetical protein
MTHEPGRYAIGSLRKLPNGAAICDDCDEPTKTTEPMLMMVNSETKAQHFVCAKCQRFYNIRKPH